MAYRDSQLETDRIVLRFVYRGESLRNGRVINLTSADSLQGWEILRVLGAEEANVDLQRWAVFFYAQDLEGWQRLLPDSVVTPKLSSTPGGGDPVRRIELMMEAKVGGGEAAPISTERLASTAVAALPTEGIEPEADGYFGIGAYPSTTNGQTWIQPKPTATGVFNSKTVENVGTLWRSAYMLGAAFIFTIGSRNVWEKAADTYKSWRRVPAFRYESWDAFCSVAPYNCQWVAVEMGGEPLSSFVHPERCVYLLGAEDAGNVSRGMWLGHSR